MNCERCRSHLSDLIDRSLIPSREGDVREHLAGCGSCRKEIRDVEESLRIFKSALPEDPPPGLRESILEEIACCDAESHHPPADSWKRLRPAWALWVGSAAALLLAGLSGVLLWQGERWKEGARSLKREAAALREDLALLRTESRKSEERWGAEREELLDSLQAAEDLVEESRRSSAEDARRREEEGKVRRGEIARLQEELERRALEIEGLRADFERSREEAGRLREELAASARRPDRPIAEREPKKVAPARREAGASGAERPPALVLRRKGGLLELELRGSRETIIPELFRLAWDESDREASDLALSTLENLLGNGSAPPSSGKGDGGEGGENLAAWWSRGMGHIASGLGLEEPPPDRPEASNRLERLKELERLYRGLPGAPSGRDQEEKR